MNAKLISLIGMVAISIVLTACSSQASTDAYATIQAVPTPELAPSYQEIRQGLKQVLTDSGYVDSLPGEEFPQNDKLVSQYNAYLEPLRGERVVKWQGWYLNSQRVGAPYQENGDYRVTILMKQPQPGTSEGYDVIVFVANPTPDEIEQFKELQYGQPIMFSGVIKTVSIWGPVAIDGWLE